MIGRWDDINAFRAKNRIERVRELLVVIPDQRPNAGFTICQVPHHLARLLGDPGTVAGYAGAIASRHKPIYNILITSPTNQPKCARKEVPPKRSPTWLYGKYGAPV